VLPYGWLGNCMTWQAHSDMYFHMAEAWAGMPPHQFQRWPAMVALYNGNYLPEPELQLKAFLAAHQVSAVLVDERARNSPDAKQRQNYATALAALGPAPMKAGGMLIYRLTPADLAAWRDFKPLDLERRADEIRFAALIDATDHYLQSGAELARLSPQRLEQTGLIRNDWIGGPDVRISNGLWVKSHPGGTIEVGTFGSRAALVELVARYRLDTLSVRTIAIPGPAASQEELELIIMTLDRNGLQRAAVLARGVPHPNDTLPGAAPYVSSSTR
jgi:hypothetical protein